MASEWCASKRVLASSDSRRLRCPEVWLTYLIYLRMTGSLGHQVHIKLLKSNHMDFGASDPGRSAHKVSPDTNGLEI